MLPALCPLEDNLGKKQKLQSTLELLSQSLRQYANSNSGATGTIGTLLQLGGTCRDRHCNGMILEEWVWNAVYDAKLLFLVGYQLQLCSGH